MQLTRLHLLLTYQCVFECGHCFVWGSPKRGGVFHLERLDAVLDQAVEMGTVSELCYEGGETFVYYPILIAAVRHATARRLVTSVVTNGYWANSAEQARIWLGRLVDAGLDRIYFLANTRSGGVRDMAAHPGVVAAEQLGLATSVIAGGMQAHVDAVPGAITGWSPFWRHEQHEPETPAPLLPWGTFTACPLEKLTSPDHAYVDPYGDLHLCHGLVIGNLFESSLASLVSRYDPEDHPISGLLLEGGPARLVTRYGLEPESRYEHACQLCRHCQALLFTRTESPAELQHLSFDPGSPVVREPQPVST
jgi:hypothetical protein